MDIRTMAGKADIEKMVCTAVGTLLIIGILWFLKVMIDWHAAHGMSFG